MFLFPDTFVLVKGAGDLGTGVAWRLHKAGFPVVITELDQPLVVRRTVAFASAVYDESIAVEGVTARLAPSFEAARDLLAKGNIPVLVDPETRAREFFQPAVLVDAVMAKRNTGTRSADAPFVLALGPGFVPGVDCHAVIETNRGHNLGRVLWNRPAEPDTMQPGEVGGRGSERVLRAPCQGQVLGLKRIGDHVKRGQVIARVQSPAQKLDQGDVTAPFDGVLRGLVRDGLAVKAGDKIGDLDPRARRDACFTISDKSLAIGGGALEAVLTWLNTRHSAGAAEETAAT